MGKPLLAEFRFSQHYPAESPVDEMARLVLPGSDSFVTEKYAFDIQQTLDRWPVQLEKGLDFLDLLRDFCDLEINSSRLSSVSDNEVRNRYGITIVHRKFAAELRAARENFLQEMRSYLAPLLPLRTAEFQITSIREIHTLPLRVAADIRYAFAGDTPRRGLEQRIGSWRTEWVQANNEWHATQWIATDETVSRANAPLFRDVTTQAFGGVTSYRQQMLRGADHWRTILDGASGIDVYGNQGIAVGDFDNDGFDDVYICQPAGLPNRLYRNRGDGTFEDATERAGLDVLDACSCALFADFENRGSQDLLLVTSAGPLLFVNDGTGKFSRREDAFKFARPPQGTFTHAAVADYDHDGRLDVYFCLYNYYAGLDQYRYPSPYFDARNGPPNFLFRNQGGWNFTDRTAAAGMNVDNDRYSFACAWGDHNGDGWPDLYVANDFGRSNLYRNNRDGTFSSIATDADVEDVGAGMSACWTDFDGDGKQDIYVANMWSAAGLRVAEQENFHVGDSKDVHAMYRRHARGNSLYKNLGNGKFRNVAAENGTEYGGWAWSSDFWDFDNDGHADIYIANGYVSGIEQPDLSSFFWRQVVGNSPSQSSPAPKYEAGWNTINELIRSDRSWSGYERNVCYCNHGDGSFSDVSGITGIDFPDDSRAFALADLDHDGRLEILLKNRNAPQLRLLRNAMPEVGNAVVFKLRGTKSNRDAIGAALTLEAAGRAQTKYVQMGSGFLSQHTKEVFFGVGNASGFAKVTVRWPSGAVDVHDRVPVNHRIEVTEGSTELRSVLFAAAGVYANQTALATEPLPHPVETWLLQPLRAPGFSLPEASGKIWDLHTIPPKKLLVLWSSSSSESLAQLRSLARNTRLFPALQILALGLDSPGDGSAIHSFSAERFPFPVLIATPEVAGTYNIFFRYLFDRHRDLGFPTSFLVDPDGIVVKVYQGELHTDRLARDLDEVPQTSADRVKLGLPFPGTLHLGAFQRNDFTYGVAFFQRGYLGAATESFKQVIASHPDDAEAHYNLGTLYLRRKNLVAARESLERTVQLKPNHTEAWNNLGMLAAEEGHIDEAVQNFNRCLELRPNYVIGLLNLGNLLRREKQFARSEEALSRALALEPENPEVNYSLGMLYAEQDEISNAEPRFERALKLRPEYADALNNFGVLLVREKRFASAKEQFLHCIRSNPDFDQAYLNLARLYVLLQQKDEARTVLENLLRRKPEHAMAQQALKMLE
jgi:Tfp pilus assembly protein PilF